jgi:hypothetical protein
MRSVLIATTGLALLLASTLAQASDDRERKGKGDGLDRLTICEVQAVTKSNSSVVDNLQVLRVGLDADITIDGITLCEAFAEKQASNLCKKKKNRRPDAFEALFSFKKVVVDPNPPPAPCTGPTDPTCFDPLTQAFKMQTVDASLLTGPCADFHRR